METSGKKENAFGFVPMVGVLLETGNSGNWKIDISTAYLILNFKNNYQYLSLGFGVLYFF